jgi:hypothetical protein
LEKRKGKLKSEKETCWKTEKDSKVRGWLGKGKKRRKGIKRKHKEEKRRSNR